MADENLLDEIIEELNVEIPLFTGDQKRKFRKFKELKKFIDQEVEYWKTSEGGQMEYPFGDFQQIQTSLQQALKASDQQKARQMVRDAVTAASYPRTPLPHSETARGKFLKELYAQNATSAKSAYNYWTQGDIRTSFGNRDSLDGILHAFHFTFCEEKRNKIDELETTFREKLRLEGPAKYWDTFADNYEKRGRIWRNWALGTAGVLVLFIIGLLATSPPWFLGPEFTAGSIRGTVLVALAVSVLIYFIRLFVKLSTSAIHLSRDARERYQLTHVFLAMVKEGAIQAEDREIILQALFSRADTGLLKTDGGPTMPTGPIGSIVSSIRGSH